MNEAQPQSKVATALFAVLHLLCCGLPLLLFAGLSLVYGAQLAGHCRPVRGRRFCWFRLVSKARLRDVPAQRRSHLK